MGSGIGFSMDEMDEKDSMAADAPYAHAARENKLEKAAADADRERQFNTARKVASTPAAQRAALSDAIDAAEQRVRTTLERRPVDAEGRACDAHPVDQCATRGCGNGALALESPLIHESVEYGVVLTAGDIRDLNGVLGGNRVITARTRTSLRERLVSQAPDVLLGRVKRLVAAFEGGRGGRTMPVDPSATVGFSVSGCSRLNIKVATTGPHAGYGLSLDQNYVWSIEDNPRGGQTLIAREKL